MKIRHKGILICLVTLLCSCTPSTVEDYVDILKSGVAAFAENKSEYDDYARAMRAAYNKAFIKAGLRYDDPEAKEFIEKWNEYVPASKELRQSFNSYLKSTDLYFCYVYKKIMKIYDEQSRNKWLVIYHKFWLKFVVDARKAHEALSAIETNVIRGNDLVTQLEVSGALGALSGRQNKIELVFKSADSLMLSLDNLIALGNDLVKKGIAAREEEAE